MMLGSMAAGLLLLGLTAADTPPDPNLTDEEFEVLIADIDAAQDKLLGLISGMTDEQWSFKPGPNRWSVAECVEHISRTERAILGGIQYSVMRPPNPGWHEETDGKLELVRKTVLTRPKNGVGSPFQVSAGSEVAPSEGWSRERAFREFYASHGRARSRTAPSTTPSRPSAPSTRTNGSRSRRSTSCATASRSRRSRPTRTIRSHQRSDRGSSKAHCADGVVPPALRAS